MENGLVLEEIFRLLSLKSLANTRLVCTTWNHEATKLLRKADHLVLLSTRADFRNFKSAMDSHVELTGQELLFKRWSLIFDELPLEDVDAQNLINTYGSFVTKLRIRFNWRIVGNHPQTFKCLLSEQMTNLVEVEFLGFSEPIWQQVNLFDETLPLLPKLKSMSFFTLDDYRHAEECPLYLNILSCLRPNQLHTLKMNCSNYLRIIFTEAPPSTRLCLQEVSTFSMVCPNNIATDLQDESCQPIDDFHSLNELFHNCSKLTSLHLCLGNVRLDQVMAAISGKLSATLKVLELTDHFPYNRRTMASPCRIFRLPHLEKAITLDSAFAYAGEMLTVMTNFPQLKYWKTNCCIIWPTVITSSYPHLTTLILHHGINQPFRSHYEIFTCEKIRVISQAYPNLTTLHLNRVNQEVFHAICSLLANLTELVTESDLYFTHPPMDCGITGIAADRCAQLHEDFAYPTVENFLTPNALHARAQVSRAYPSIGNLRSLRRLTIKAVISEISFYYGFAELSELTSLTVEILEGSFQIQMTEVELISILRKLHKLVRLEITIANGSRLLFSRNCQLIKQEFPALEFVINIGII